MRSLFAGLFGNTAVDVDVRRAIARTVELVDPQLGAVGGLERRLAPATRQALDYAARLVSQVPGPISISRPAFAADPLVHALFATAADIETMLGTSQAVRDYLQEVDSHGALAFHALFAARRVEKRQLGLAIQGEVIRGDVPQTVLYFSDHALTEPTAEPERLRSQLQTVAFDSLLRSFSAHLSALRSEREDVRAGLSVERAHLTVLRGKSGGAEHAVHTRRVAELDARLRSIGGELSPPAIVDALSEFLGEPESSLRLEPHSVTVDRLGIVVDRGDGSGRSEGADGVNTLDFPELIGRDNRRHLVMLARIEVAEAREAVERVTAAQRRFVII